MRRTKTEYLCVNSCDRETIWQQDVEMAKDDEFP